MEVTLHTPDTIYAPRHVPSWPLLAGAAGAVNGFAFLMCRQFVTPVTGTVTRRGREGAGRVDAGAGVVSSPRALGCGSHQPDVARVRQPISTVAAATGRAQNKYAGPTPVAG
jgi:hypothetical protein